MGQIVYLTLCFIPLVPILYVSSFIFSDLLIFKWLSDVLWSGSYHDCRFYRQTCLMMLISGLHLALKQISPGLGHWKGFFFIPLDSVIPMIALCDIGAWVHSFHHCFAYLYHEGILISSIYIGLTRVLQSQRMDGYLHSLFVFV